LVAYNLGLFGVDIKCRAMYAIILTATANPARIAQLSHMVKVMLNISIGLQALPGEQ